MSEIQAQSKLNLVFAHLLQDTRGDVGQRNGLVRLADIWMKKGQAPSARVAQDGRLERFTLEHVLDKNAALDDLLVCVELLVVRGDEEDHFEVEGY